MTLAAIFEDAMACLLGAVLAIPVLLAISFGLFLRWWHVERNRP